MAAKRRSYGTDIASAWWEPGDPAGSIFLAVSTFKLFESIRYAAEKLAVEKFSLMLSYVGVTAVCDDLKITCDPHAAIPVAKTVQRKMFGPEVPYIPAPTSGDL